MSTQRFIALLTVCLIAVAGCGGGGGSPPSPPVTPPPVPPSPIDPGVLGDNRLGDLVEKVRERHGVPAMAAMIVADGVILERAVDGVRSIDSAVPVSGTDRWHIGSVGKAMTATLAAVLVEQGVLSWDTTPAIVWPADEPSMHSAYRDVTIVQLLAHQAGIQPDQHMIPSIAMTEDDAPGTIVDKRRLWSRELLQLKPANAIGEFNYANGGYIIVGSMLETLTGQSWESLMMDEVFTPLGMLSSGFGAPGTPGQVDEPWGHWRQQNGVLVSLSPGPGSDSRQAIGPAGTIHTTMDDYAMFMFAHLEGELGFSGLVSADTFRFLHEAVGGHDYALGWQIQNNQPWALGPLLHHTGTNLRWFANAGIIPGLNSGIFIAINAGDQGAIDASDELGVLLLTRIRDSQ